MISESFSKERLQNQVEDNKRNIQTKKVTGTKTHLAPLKMRTEPKRLPKQDIQSHNKTHRND